MALEAERERRSGTRAVTLGPQAGGQDEQREEPHDSQSVLDGVIAPASSSEKPQASPLDSRGRATREYA